MGHTADLKVTLGTEILASILQSFHLTCTFLNHSFQILSLLRLNTLFQLLV